MSDWTAEDLPSFTGRRVIVTGGNSGLGFEAASVLLTKVQRWSPLKAWGLKLAKRIGGEEGQARHGPQACRHPSLYLDRWHRVLVVEGGGGRLRT